MLTKTGNICAPSAQIYGHRLQSAAALKAFVRTGSSAGGAVRYGNGSALSPADSFTTAVTAPPASGGASFSGDPS